MVGRSTTTQSTLGQSQPSVSNMELHSTLYFPASKSVRISLRSALWPLTSAARKPLALSRSRNFWLVLMRGKNTTVLRPAQCCAISGGDLAEVWIQRSAKFPHGVVAAAEGHAGDVQLEGDGLGHDAAQIPLFDGIGQLVLIGQRVKHLAQVPHIAAVGGGGHAQHLGVLEVVQDAAVAIGDGVVGFVDDDGAEIIPGKALQPRRALQGLNRTDHDPEPAAQTGGLGFFHGADKAGGTLELVGCLLQQLPPVGQDEHPGSPART